jgi:signal transduction histidine kinase
MGAPRGGSPVRGIGPSTVQRIVRDRAVRLAVGLAVVVAIPVATLFYFQFRSLNAIEDTSTVVLHKFSQETADGLTKQIEQALKTPHIGVLLRITQGRTEPLDLPFIEPIFVEQLRESPFIDTFYVWSETDDEFPNEVLTLDRSQLADFPPPTGPSDQKAADPFVLHLRRRSPDGPALVAELHELAKQKWAIVAVQMPIGGRTKYVQAQLRFKNPATRDHLSSFVAFATDPQRLRHEYFPALMSIRLRDYQSMRGFPPLVVSVLDERGDVVYQTAPAPVDRFVDEREFPLIFFDKELLQYAVPFETHREIWRLRTGYGAKTVPEIVRASIMPQRRMMAFLAVVMAAGVFFVARAAAREVRLAELKSNFVSSVSHDLKTPLALIQLFAETLELGRVKTADRAQEYYRIINSEARKLTRLINNILDFSRIEAGLRMYRMTAVDLADLSRRVVASLDSHFKQHNFAVTVRAATDVPQIVADGEAVAQALENLLSNAMKYSPTDRRILVEVAREDGLACVKVVDYGVGVPRTQMRKIFRKFYRVDDNGFGPQGSGLGLAIVDHIMRAHRGSVRVESEPGRGSTFTLCFRIPDQAALAAAGAADAEPVTAGTSRRAS